MTENLSGRDLDAAVAEKLFGWRWYRNKKSNLIGLWPPADSGWIRYNFSEAFFDDVTGRESEYERYSDWHNMAEPEDSQSACGCRMGLPRYSTDWSAMRLVVEEMQAKGWSYELRRRLSGKPEAIFTTDDCEVSAVGGDMPEAVSLAALKALEVDGA